MVGVPRNQIAVSRLDEMFFARDLKLESSTYAVSGLFALVAVRSHVITLLKLHEGDHHPLTGRPNKEPDSLKFALFVILPLNKHTPHLVSLVTSSRIRSRSFSDGSLKIGIS